MSQKPISVYRPGSVVLVGEKVEAVVVKVCFEANMSICYQCAWWVAGDRKEQWLWDFEIKTLAPISSQSKDSDFPFERIGFK